MILKFNLQYLESISSDAQNLVDTLRHYYQKPPVRPRWINKKYLHQNMLGTSFILNPTAIFEDRYTEPVYLSQYIKLAARRDYAMYKLYGDKTLDLSFFPDINYQNISHNPLLSKLNNRLYFKYEEH